MSKNILCINGSDSMGNSGIQADVKAAKDLGCYATTAVTSITVQNNTGIKDIHELPTELVEGQINAVYDDSIPNAIKVGMINNPEAIKSIRKYIVGCKNIVCSPVILASHGGCLMSNESIAALVRHIIPISKLLLLKCTDAGIILGRSISTDNDMVEAANALVDMGAEWVLLRGGIHMEGRINALLFSKTHQEFFSSLNISGWQKHGVGGTLSTAIASRLALGDEITASISNAHSYLHSQVVYASQKNATSLRPNDLYNSFLSVVANNYHNAHDVAFYADKLSITTRYLSQITGDISGRTPKQIIDTYILQEAEQLLTTTTQTIQQISNTLGFSSQVTFAKLFRTKKGKSPSAFRNRE